MSLDSVLAIDAVIMHEQHYYRSYDRNLYTPTYQQNYNSYQQNYQSSQQQQQQQHVSNPVKGTVLRNSLPASLHHRH